MTSFEMLVLMALYGIWGHLAESRLLTLGSVLFGLAALAKLLLT